MSRQSDRVALAVSAALAMILATVVAPGTASAQDEGRITIGLYAPTTPLGGPSERLQFISALASHLSSATGKQVSGRVYSSAGAFSGAVKKGNIQFAVVDAPYAAARRLPYKILAAAVRNGSSTASWQLVAASGVSNLSDLDKKQVAVPRVGAKEPSFVANVLLGGEVEPKYFAKITTAPNPNAAATMVSVGRVTAAFVPEGTKLPGGVSRVFGLGSVGLPMFVALKGTDDTMASEFGGAVKGFSGRGVISGFGGAGAGEYRELRGRFGKSKRPGVMSTPKPARLAVRGILGERKFVITPSDVAAAVAGPPGKIASASGSKKAGKAGPKKRKAGGKKDGNTGQTRKSGKNGAKK